MFSGIIRHIGIINRIDVIDDSSMLLRLESSLFDEKTSIGDSVSVSGVCLTVTSTYPGFAEFHVGSETIRCTSLKNKKVNDTVHLEPSLRVGDTLDGHFVYGHVDTTAMLNEMTQEGETWRLTFSVAREYENYLISKGSIALDGVSLTIGEVSRSKAGESDGSCIFSVYIIPHTYSATNFHKFKVGTEVNFEIDPIARYTISSLSIMMHGKV